MMAEGKPAAGLEALDAGWKGLRADIELRVSAADEGGQAAWVIEDPVSGRYFRVGQVESVVVEALRSGASPSAALERVQGLGLPPPTPAVLRAFLGELRQAGLCREGDAAADGTGRGQPGFWTRLLHGYVYYRIPLLRPDAWLTRLAPVLRPLASPLAARALRYVGLLGVLLALPQAQLYFSTASYLLTPTGFVSFIACLVALKLGHELAHALSAKLKGLHVRSMGVAFILLWPILYTDVTDAWREPDRRRRAQIGSAGIRFELAVAGAALLLWSVLPDGVLRSLAFYLSSASILSTLLINLNPFMRFDGYYLLMDVWGIDNLQPRAFALLRHRLRRICLGWRGQAPEAPPQAPLMVAYAVATLAYRVFVAIAIAMAVFAFIGALAGVLVAALELYILLLRPLARELRALVTQRANIGSQRRTLATLGVLGVVALALVLPLERTLAVPGLLMHERLQYVSAPFEGRIVTLPPAVGTAVEEGAVLLVLESAAQRHALDRLDIELRHNRAQQQALDTRGSEGGYRKWLQEEERRLLAARAAAESRLAQRVVHAAAGGELVERHPDYQVGDTVAADVVLASVRQSPRLRVNALVEDKYSALIDPAGLTRARLRPWDTGLPGLEVVVAEAQPRAAESLPSVVLYDRYGGPIAAVQSGRKNLGADTAAALRTASALQPRDAYQAFSFVVDLPAMAERIPDATPAWVELQLQPVSVLGQFLTFLVRTVSR